MPRLPTTLAATALLLAACTRPAPARDVAHAAHAAHAARTGATAASAAAHEPGDDAAGAADFAADDAADRVSVDDLAATWRDQAGRQTTLAALRAPVRVMALVYTSCRTTCPLVVADLKKIEASIPAGRRADVRFVLVSLDPERDTPGRLAEWAASTRLDAARWTLLNGSDDAVRELAATLDVRYQRQAGGEVAHTNAITVLGADGAVAHQQLGLGDPADETVAAVGRLLR